jgi:hypothetical protein
MNTTNFAVFFVQKALRRHQLENVNFRRDRPVVRGGGLPQLLLGFRQCDVKALFAGVCALEQELQSKRRFARTGYSFHQIEPIADETAVEDIVEPRRTKLRLGGSAGSLVHGPPR